MSSDTNTKKATIYRMVMPDHLCPYGLKAVDLLERKGFQVEDHHLESREETDAFQEKHGVDTTPQTWIGDERIGGYDALREHFGENVPDEDETSYKPVIAIFAVGFLMALAVSWVVFGTIFTVRAVEWFIAISMTLLALQKLQDVESFSTMFLNYDLLARRWVRYGYIYKRELKCACVGGGSNVPLGFVSLTENLMMVAMAIWMPVRMCVLGW